MASENEKNEDLLPVLNEDDAARWPAVWRAPALADLAISSETEDKILADIRARFPAQAGTKTEPRALDEKRKRKSAVRLYLSGGLAAAAAILLGLFIFRGEFSGPARVVAAVTAASPAKWSGRTLRAGDRLDLAAGGQVFIRYGSEYALRFAGPGSLTFAAEKNQLELKRGRIALRSLKENIQPPLLLRTPALEYRIAGTVAELNITENGQSLIVLQGRVNARYRGEARTMAVDAGRKLELTGAKIAAREEVRSTAASPSELRALRTRDEELRKGVPAPGQSPPPAQTQTDTKSKTPRKPITRPRARKKLFTLGQIRSKFGSIHLVRLKDGRRYLGHMRIVDGKVEIHTEYGVKKVPRSLFKSAQEK